MLQLVPAIFVSSLLGSVHCIAMCGPLLGLAGPARSVPLALLHSVGRLVTYVSLGFAAGSIGRAVDLAGQLAAVQHVATILAGGVVIAWAGASYAVAKGWIRPRRMQADADLFRIRSRRPSLRALSLGVLTGFLPCGWLWAFVVAAAGTAHGLQGAVVMATFWLGTVPAMVGAHTFAAPVIAALRKRMPAVTACALIAIGVGTLALRWRDAGAEQVEHPHCHEAM